MTCYLFCDCETTGIKPTDKIIELAYIAFNEDFEELYRGQSLIDPQMTIPSGASAVNGITNFMVVDQPTIEEYMATEGYPLLIEDAVLVAFNSVFDARYLSRWMVPDFKQLCTMRLAKKVYMELDSYKLQAIRYSLDLPVPEGDAHRAMFDVEMMVNFVKRAMTDTGLNLSGLLDLVTKPIEIKKWGFGKFKGQKIDPNNKDHANYVEWYLKQESLDPDLAATLTKLFAK